MPEVVLDVKLASLGVLNISPRGLTDFDFRLSCVFVDFPSAGLFPVRVVSECGFAPSAGRAPVRAPASGRKVFLQCEGNSLPLQEVCVLCCRLLPQSRGLLGSLSGVALAVFSLWRPSPHLRPSPCPSVPVRAPSAEPALALATNFLSASTTPLEAGAACSANNLRLPRACFAGL